MVEIRVKINSNTVIPTMIIVLNNNISIVLQEMPINLELIVNNSGYHLMNPNKKLELPIMKGLTLEEKNLTLETIMQVEEDLTLENRKNSISLDT